MSAAVTIEFPAGATMSSGNCTVSVVSGSFALGASDGVSLVGTFPFTSLSLTESSLVLACTPGTTYTGTIAVALAGPDQGNGTPTISVAGFAGAATIYWPSSDGMQYQELISADPIALTGYTG